MKGLRNTLKHVALVMIILAGWVSIVSADARQFIPRLLDYAGFLTFESAYEAHNDETEGRSLTRNDLYVREKLTLAGLGYIYHPRFILLSMVASGGLKEERLGGNVQSSPFRAMGSWEYDLRMYVLPEHPYKLELFTTRVEPLVKGVVSPEFQTVAYSSGAIFRYKQKPYFLNVHYLRNSTESSTADYTTQKYGFLGTYYKELYKGNNYSFNASYDHQTSSSATADGKSDEAAIGNTVTYNWLRLSSELAFHRFDQTGFQGVSTSGNNFSWTERGNLTLPWNFRADMAYIFTKNDITFTGLSAGETNLSDTINNASFSISHKLYQSLISTYRFGYISSTSDTGELKTTSNNLGFAYSKNIPSGILRAQFSVGKTKTDGTGVLSFVNEEHNQIRVSLGVCAGPADQPLSCRFTLNGRHVKKETIVLFLKSPFAAGELVPLRENVDYIVTVMDSITQIDMIGLPSGFSVPGTYDFVANYTSDQNTGYMTDSLNSSISLELFNQTLVPYWNHDVSKETITAGSPGTLPISFTANSYGVTYRKKPFLVTAEYRVVSSNFNPSKGWRAQVNYVKDIYTYTELDATVLYSSTNYPHGTSGFEETAAYTETIYGLSAGVRHRIPKRNMFIYVGGSYSSQKSLGNSNTYSLNSTFTWNVGKISVDAGATVSFADSDIGGVTTKRTDQYYYLSVKRQLF